MKAVSLYSIAVLLLLTTSFSRYSAAQESASDSSKVLAVVPVVKGAIDQKVYRHFDRLVPELKKISRNSVVVLECSHSGKPEREQDVVKAFQLAGRIEKYFRERHKLDIDLWVTVRLSQKALTALTLTVYAEGIKLTDSTPVDLIRN